MLFFWDYSQVIYCYCLTQEVTPVPEKVRELVLHQYVHNNTRDDLFYTHTTIVNTETRLDYQLTVVDYNQLQIFS